MDSINSIDESGVTVDFRTSLVGRIGIRIAG
jgi:hypothetical protein